MLVKVDLLPRLRDILNSCYDPNGGLVPSEKDPSQLVMAPWSAENVCTGTISLNCNDYEAFVMLCKQVRHKDLAIPIVDLGGGAALVGIADLATAVSKVAADTEVLVEVPASQ